MPFGPRKPTGYVFIIRLIASLAGGIIGSLSIFAIFVFSQVLFTAEAENPLSLFIIILIIFVGSLLTNLITVFMISYFDREIYSRHLTILTQAFIIQVILFLFSVPFYILIHSLPLGAEHIRYVAGFHLLLSTQICALLLELLAETPYKMVGLYGISFGSFFSMITIIMVIQFNLEFLLIFIIPPLLWVSMELFRSLADILYYYFYKFYGIDVLNTKTNLTEDETS